MFSGRSIWPIASCFLALDGRTLRLWVTDGTEAGTVPLTDASVDFSVPRIMLNGHRFFAALDEAHGEELWVTDGTPEGTIMLRDIQPGPGSSFPEKLMIFDNEIYFTAETADGKELWKTDGTPASTLQIVEYPLSAGADITQIAALNELIVYILKQNSGYSLWKTDGRAEGTLKIQDLGTSTVQNFLAGGSRAYFSQVGGRIWSTDGTAAGTIMLLEKGNDFSYKPVCVYQDSIVFFNETKKDNMNGDHYALWRTDGTAAGTSLFMDNKQAVRLLPDVNQQTIIILQDRPGTAEQAWITDGTLSGTLPTTMPNLNVGLLQQIYDETKGWQLWEIDETPTGRHLFANLPGDKDSQPEIVGIVDHTLFFSYFDAAIGKELWAMGLATQAAARVWRPYE